MLITDTGVLVRTPVRGISILGRTTKGVTLINLDEGAKLNGLQRIVEKDAQGQEGEGESGDEDGANPAPSEPTP